MTRFKSSNGSGTGLQAPRIQQGDMSTPRLSLESSRVAALAPRASAVRTVSKTVRDPKPRSRLPWHRNSPRRVLPKLGRPKTRAILLYCLRRWRTATAYGRLAMPTYARAHAEATPSVRPRGHDRLGKPQPTGRDRVPACREPDSAVATRWPAAVPFGCSATASGRRDQAGWMRRAKGFWGSDVSRSGEVGFREIGRIHGASTSRCPEGSVDTDGHQVRPKRPSEADQKWLRREAF